MVFSTSANYVYWFLCNCRFFFAKIVVAWVISFSISETEFILLVFFFNSCVCLCFHVGGTKFLCFACRDRLNADIWSCCKQLPKVSRSISREERKRESKRNKKKWQIQIVFSEQTIVKFYWIEKFVCSSLKAATRSLFFFLFFLSCSLSPFLRMPSSIESKTRMFKIICALNLLAFASPFLHETEAFITFFPHFSGWKSDFFLSFRISQVVVHL